MPTRIRRTDGELLGIAGLWEEWTDRAGQIVRSYTMLTINADTHPIFKELHRPDPKRPPDMQDKRMVVILPRGLYVDWLDAPAEKTIDFMRQFPADRLVAEAQPREPRAG